MKRRFEFRLERVRRVRDLEERVARSERARAESVARAAEASRDQARSVLERSRAWLRELLEAGGDPRGATLAERTSAGELTDLRKKLELARTQRLQAERMAALHREKKGAARALEELRERERTRHAAELEKLENARLDEIAQRRARPEAERAPTPSSPAIGPADPGRSGS
ncbi:MAG TPA: hypothetical protein VF530_10120 [Planctomycetota bacterium]